MASKNRELILKIVNESGTIHPTADYVFAEARKQLPGIGLATVYRNLNSLVDNHEIQRLTFPDAPDRYDKSIANHGHAVCKECGKVIDYTFGDEETNNFVSQIQNLLGDKATAKGVHIVVNCVCADCCAKR